MFKNIKDKSDKECIDKINQLNKERKPITYIESRYDSLETDNISKHQQILKNN